MNVLLLSAYHAASHRQWAEGLMSHCAQLNGVQVDWRLLSLPARHFSWRIRGNTLSWAMQDAAILDRPFDTIVATSMTDLATLKGLVPNLAACPSVVYFHENQFAYPGRDQQHASLEPCMVNLYSALAADQVLFNSDYNRRSFLDGCDALLARLPDFVPRAEVMAKLDRARVLPVGIEPAPALPRAAGERLQLLWNHRWEYDKGPEGLLAIAQQCERRGLAIDFHIVGQRFRREPDCFAQLRQQLSDSRCLGLGQWGYVEDRSQYQALLQRCDVVLSTALHDFQGLSVMEAVAAGCVPLLPDRLCYPEFYPAECLYSSQSRESEADAAAAQLAARLLQKQRGALRAPDVSRFFWSRLVPDYQALLASLQR